MHQRRLIDEPEAATIRVLTVAQPWAWAIFHAGKCYENRGWSTRHRGELWIHAGRSRKFWAEGLAFVRAMGFEPPPWESIERGAIVGRVMLVNCLPIGDVADAWAFGPWCWQLAQRELLPAAIPHRGSLGLARAPRSLLAPIAR